MAKNSDPGRNRAISSKSRPEHERTYTMSIDEEGRRKSFELEDRRWTPARQLRDWIVLVIAIVIWLGFQLSIYFLVPGIR